MKRKNCLACVYLGKTTDGVCQDPLYIDGDAAVSLPLCYSHSVELFKFGQKLFVVKYGLEHFESYIETKNNYDNNGAPFFFNSFR